MSQNILITGANRGIGLALARQYTAAGAHVFAVCRTPSDELNALANTHVIAGIDVTQADASQQISAALANTQLDILIQNAGILIADNQHDIKVENITAQLAINAVAPVMLTLGLLPHLSAGSKVALITSRMGSMADNGSGGYYGYRMSKAALNAAGVSLARDLASQSIAVGLLHPGFVQTDMVNHAGDITAAEAAQRLCQRITELSLANSGRFWHSNGESLPW